MGITLFPSSAVPKDGDDDSTDNITEGVIVEIVFNGYIVRTTTQMGDEFTEVYQKDRDDTQMLKDIADALGVSGVTIASKWSYE